MPKPIDANLLRLLKNDTIYQQMLEDCIAAESAYLAALRTLSDKDREAVEKYIGLCEEMDHRALTLAVSTPL